MNKKGFFVISIIFSFFSLIFSVFYMWQFFSFLTEVNGLVYEADELTDGESRVAEQYVEDQCFLATQEHNQGQKQKAADDIELVSLGEFRLTAYCSCEKCCGYWATVRPVDENGDEIVYGSSGEILISGVSVAVDTSVIPFGSKLIINGNIYIAHDTGSGIEGKCIDVYYDNHQKAVEFGLQCEEVFLIEQ